MCVGCSKKKTCALYGKWTECLYAADAAAFEAHKKNNKKVTEDKKVREVRFQTAKREKHNGFLNAVLPL